MSLCSLVARQSEPCWNNSWLKKKMVANLPLDSIVNREVLKEMGQVISFNERISYEEIAGIEVIPCRVTRGDRAIY